jgi:hypothetical protein
MTDSQVRIAQRVQRRFVEDLRHQTHVFEDNDLGALADRDSRRLLASVLQCVKPEVGELRDLLARSPDPEDTTCILWPTILGIDVVVQQAITSCHRFIVTVRTTDNRQLRCGTRRVRAICPLLLPWSQPSLPRTILLLGLASSQPPPLLPDWEEL